MDKGISNAHSLLSSKQLNSHELEGAETLNLMTTFVNEVYTKFLYLVIIIMITEN